MSEQKICRQQLNNAIEAHLKHKIEEAEEAAMNAHHAAIDEQSVAETQYDTLAIEAGYLAEGQSRRIKMLKEELTWLEQYQSTGSENKEVSVNQVTIGSIVTLIDSKECDLLYYILPVVAGLRISADSEQGTEGPCVTVVTPKSPLGQLLLGAELDDELCIPFGKNNKIVWIDNIN